MRKNCEILVKTVREDNTMTTQGYTNANHAREGRHR